MLTDKDVTGCKRIIIRVHLFFHIGALISVFQLSTDEWKTDKWLAFYPAWTLPSSFHRWSLANLFRAWVQIPLYQTWPILNIQYLKKRPTHAGTNIFLCTVIRLSPYTSLRYITKWERDLGHQRLVRYLDCYQIGPREHCSFGSKL